jgi:hypothetical protein
VFQSMQNITTEASAIGGLTALMWAPWLRSVANANNQNPSFRTLLQEKGSFFPRRTMSNAFFLAFFNVSFHRLAGDNPYLASVLAASGSAPWSLMMALDVAKRKESLSQIARQMLLTKSPVNRGYLALGFTCEATRELMYNVGCLNPPEITGLSPLQQLAMRCVGYFSVGAVTGLPNLAANWFYLSAIAASTQMPRFRHVALGCFWRGVAMEGIFGTKDIVTYVKQLEVGCFR